MSDGLGVGGDAIVFFGGKMDEFTFETVEDCLDEFDGFGGGAVVDDHERLAFGVYAGAVEGVAGHDFHVGWKVLFERCDFRRFGRGLAADDGALFGGRAEVCDDGVDVLCFDRVHDPVTAAGDEVAI